MTTGRAADLLQCLLIDAVDDAALHHRRLVAHPDPNRLDGDFGAGGLAGGRRRIDARVRCAVGEQDDHSVVLGLRTVRVRDHGLERIRNGCFQRRLAQT